MTLVPFRKVTAPSGYSSGFDEFDRIFDNLFRNALTNIAAPATSVGNMAVRMNVGETDKAYVIEAELPGFEEKDVELTLKDGVLTLSGERRHEEEAKDRTFHRIERSYGSFTRSLQLPSDADEGRIEAHMRNGVLEIEIGKLKEAQKEAKRISISKK